jgi:outer membrane protein assembly factor BamB
MPPAHAVGVRWSVAGTFTYLAGDTVYADSYPDRIAALDAQTGQQRWETELKEWARPCALADGVLCAASEHTLYGLDAASGRLLWSYLPKSSVGFLEVLSGNGLFYLPVWGKAAGLVALDAKTGTVRWESHAVMLSSRETAIGGLIYLTSDDDVLYVLDALTGAPPQRNRS